MDGESNYIEINKRTWDQRTPIHIQSAFYDNANFLKGRSSLKEVELDLLGDVAGKSILHLQCHFGQDSISLSRMGAQVTGIDLSEEAIRHAIKFAGGEDAKPKFICCNIYDLPALLDGQFDIVFTSYGTISWLPDLDRWGAIISRFLKPGGRFVFVEFHPVVWMFDDEFDHIGYNYFNSGPVVEAETGTYADKEAPVRLDYVNWNHSISEILNSLIHHGLEINAFNEFDYSPYNCFRHTIEFAPGKYRIRHLDNKIPMLFSLLARKKKDDRARS